MDQLEDRMRRVPKVDLHAHLNGSISMPLLLQLLRERNEDQAQAEEMVLRQRGNRSLQQCFHIFSLIHRVSDSTDVIRRITQAVIDEYAAEGTVYLELRTTPRAIPSEREYLLAVLAVLRDRATVHPSLTVRLLISINRSQDEATAMQTVQLAAELQSQGHSEIVGVDLSGNPSTGTFATWLPALKRARDLGLRISLHFAEVDNEEEGQAMLAFRPERLGHACVMSEQLQAEMLASGIPLEVCLTSNVKTDSVPGYADHHAQLMLASRHPIAICTDDRGVFETSLSKEYALAAHHLALDDSALIRISRDAVGMCFASDVDKAKVLAQIDAVAASLQQ